MSGVTVRISRSLRNAMYSVTAALKRRSYSSALATGGSGGSAAFLSSSIARRACERASSRSISATTSAHVYGTSWTCFRYQS